MDDRDGRNKNSSRCHGSRIMLRVKSYGFFECILRMFENLFFRTLLLVVLNGEHAFARPVSIVSVIIFLSIRFFAFLLRILDTVSYYLVLLCGKSNKNITPLLKFSNFSLYPSTLCTCETPFLLYCCSRCKGS